MPAAHLGHTSDANVGLCSRAELLTPCLASSLALGWFNLCAQAGRPGRLAVTIAGVRGGQLRCELTSQRVADAAAPTPGCNPCAVAPDQQQPSTGGQRGIGSRHHACTSLAAAAAATKHTQREATGVRCCRLARPGPLLLLAPHLLAASDPTPCAAQADMIGLRATVPASMRRGACVPGSAARCVW